MTTDLQLLYGPHEIAAIVERLAKEIKKDYCERKPVLLTVLKGAYVFTADLSRAIGIDLEIDFIQPSSYDNGTRPEDNVVLLRRLTENIRGRHVIIVEGIVDRGLTLQRVLKEVIDLKPASVKVCALLVRDGVNHDFTVHYRGESISNGFVVGYGMDMDGRYRQLKGLHILKEG